MKYALFAGCVSRGGCPELYPATLKVCQKLGFFLDELHERGATCTGAGVLQEKNQFLGDVFNARTFAIAESIGLTPSLIRLDILFLRNAIESKAGLINNASLARK
mgnify:CR=1 FL=1